MIFWSKCLSCCKIIGFMGGGDREAISGGIEYHTQRQNTQQRLGTH